MKQTLFLLLLSSTMVLAEDYTLSTRNSSLSGDITGYESVTLTVQNSTSNGGAALVPANKVLNITGNGSVNLTGSSTSMSGGSLTVGAGAQLNIANNTGLVNISSNTAGGSGGALNGLQPTSPITISNNSGGVTISGNVSSQYGGAISASGALTISNNGKVSITHNASTPTSYRSTYNGGAISQRTQKGSFTIIGNDYVEFRGNYCTKLNRDGSTATAWLNAIHQENTTQKNTISAKTGGKVVFYDSITCAGNTGVSGASYELNANYSNGDSEAVESKGCITFSGKYAAEELSKLGSAADLTASLTSTLLASTTLHNGTLSIEDGAILQTQILTLKADTGACLNLQNGKLDTTGYSATFGNGSLIRAVGVNSITSTAITIANDSVITLDLTGATADSTILTLAATDGLMLGTHLTLNIVGADGLAAGNYNLLNLGDADISGISIEGAAPSSLTWERGILSIAIIPEPATATLSMLALVGLAVRRRRKQKLPGRA